MNVTETVPRRQAELFGEMLARISMAFEVQAGVYRSIADDTVEPHFARFYEIATVLEAARDAIDRACSP